MHLDSQFVLDEILYVVAFESDFVVIFPRDIMKWRLKILEIRDRDYFKKILSLSVKDVRKLSEN